MGRAARYMYERTGLPGRAVYSDLGNWQVIRGYVDSGVMEPFNIANEPNMLMLLHKLARGYWPTKLENGVPVERHPVPDKAVIPVGDAKMKLSPGAGFYIFEGLTSTSDLLMRYLRDYRINIKGEVPSPFSILDPDTGKPMLFASNSLAHFGYVQDEMVVSLMAELAALPTERVFVTAHESEGQDDDTKDPIRGPALAGKKGTPRIGKNVGDLLHFEVVPAKAKDGLVEADYRVYFRSHPDSKFPNITYPCKTRMAEEQVAELEKQFPGGYFSPNNFDKFLQVYDELLVKSGSGITDWKESIDKARKGNK